MSTISLQEAQARLEELIRQMPPGGELVITENNMPVAKLARTEPSGPWGCEPGSAKHLPHWMAPDFDEPLEEFREYME
jgi:antitoxin (DNA-binding transcriptional repressor) of toxin-antitoxin stability system